MLRRNWKLLLFLFALVIVPHMMMSFGEAHDPYAIQTSRSYLAPSREYLFGTDSLGRDMLARTLYAAGLSLKVVVQSVAVSFLLSLSLGSIAGFTSGRWPDHIVTWLISLLYTVPFMLIVVAIFTVIEPRVERAYIIIGCVAWAAPARLVRAEVMQVRASPFILAEKAFGLAETRILFRSILPLSFMPALFSLLYYVPELIGIEVGLSFFGLGAQPPTPSLGRLIYDGLSEVFTAWWLTFIPAAVLLISMCCIYGITTLLSKQTLTSGWGNE